MQMNNSDNTSDPNIQPSTSSEDAAQVNAFLGALAETVSYNLSAIKKQIELLNSAPHLSPATMLMRRGLACAYASLFDQAIDDLRAALSLRCENESFIRGKLAQALTRRNSPGDADEAIRLCSSVIDDKNAGPDSRWLAAQVTAVACLAVGRTEESARAAKLAVSIRSDDRSSGLLALTEPTTTAGNADVRSFSSVVGWLPVSDHRSILKNGQILLGQERTTI
jgi:tetratricopeptide (TPR) repeat protein